MADDKQDLAEVTVPYSNMTESTAELDKKPLQAGIVLTRLKLLVIAAAFVLLLMVVIILGVFLARSRAKLETGSKARVVKPTGRTSPVPTTPGTDPWWNFRLPNDVIPLHYDLFLDVDMARSRYTGSVSITVTVTQSTDLILLHCKDMNVTSVIVTRSSGGAKQPIRNRFSFEKYQYYVIQMGSRLEPAQYVIVMTYEALLGDEVGLFKGDYKKSDGTNVTYIASQLQPTEARGVFPCFDEPGFKATFNVSIAHDPKYFAVSNMPVYRAMLTKEKKIEYFAKTPNMSTYLLAFLVCDFNKTTTTTSDNVKLTFYVEPNKYSKAAYAVALASKVIPFYSRYFGMKYPLPKNDFASLNDFSHDMMEDWGLIMVKEQLSLWSQSDSAAENKQSIAIDTAHMLAHQWFGNLVTVKWWNDYWLQEGFAEHFMSLAVDFIQPNWKIADMFFIELVREAFSSDGLISSRPIAMNVTGPDDIEEITDFSTNTKGGAVVRMLEDFLGPDVFKEGVKRFLAKNAYGSVIADDLWRAFKNETCSRGSCVDVKPMMDTWTLQMGYPVVTIKEKDRTHFDVTQTRFLIDKMANASDTKFKSPFNYKWVVPFTYITSINPQTKRTLKLDMADGVINADGSLWIKGNYKHKGFYLVNYEERNWDALANQLKTDYTVFDSADRAGLLQDIFYLARAGLVKYSRVLAMTEYMNKEPEYVPWQAFDNSIGFIRGLLPRTSQAFKNIKKYLWYQAKKKYFQLGFVDTGTTLDKITRERMVGIACSAGEKTCINNVTALFQAWMNNPAANAIPPNFRNLVYSYGIENGGVKEWDFAFSQYQKTQDLTAKDAILHGLFPTKEPWVIRRFLDYALDPMKIKPDEALHVIGDIALHNTIGRQLAWEFAVKNWKLILKRYATSGQLSWMIESLTRGFSTPYELDMLTTFAADKMHSGVIKRSFSQAVERVKTRIDWLKENESDVSDWLAKFVKDNNL